MAASKLGRHQGHHQGLQEGVQNRWDFHIAGATVIAVLSSIERDERNQE